MILAKTRYKTYDSEFLEIVKGFQTWKHYLKDWNHKPFVFNNHNNFCRFMNIKDLSSKQVF